MDRDRIEKEFRALEQWLDDSNPPLLAVVVLANGAGHAFTYPLAELAKERGDPHEIHAVLSTVRAALLDLAATLQTSRLSLERALTTYREERGEGVERPQGDA
jgi:NAD(P)H-flavin reductase